jgi:hypothetical protein
MQRGRPVGQKRIGKKVPLKEEYWDKKQKQENIETNTKDS